jgi:beta-catenin-like protein 1
MLDRNNQGLHNILDSLRMYEEHVDDDPTDGSVSQREILKGLISALTTT